VLTRVARALEQLGLRVALATGSADDPPELPPHWLVRVFLPQVTLLKRAAAAVTHGGNNSVTEAATFGVPLVVLPFSTDQFAGAAAIEKSGWGVALAPNTATVDELATAIAAVLEGPRGPLAASLQAEPGRDRAYRAVTARS